MDYSLIVMDYSHHSVIVLRLRLYTDIDPDFSLTKVIDSVWTPSNSITLYPGKLVDLTEVKCSLPESPVNIGDYGNEGVTAAGLKIAVSNNGINASQDSMLLITYDSVCQECNTTIGCRLRVCINTIFSVNVTYTECECPTYQSQSLMIQVLKMDGE